MPAGIAALLEVGWLRARCKHHGRDQRDAMDAKTVETAMKKILVGLAVVAILCMVGGAGYRFGQYLAERDAPVRQANAGA